MSTLQFYELLGSEAGIRKPRGRRNCAPSRINKPSPPAFSIAVKVFGTLCTHQIYQTRKWKLGRESAATSTLSLEGWRNGLLGGWEHGALTQLRVSAHHTFSGLWNYRMFGVRCTVTELVKPSVRPTLVHY